MAELLFTQDVNHDNLANMLEVERGEDSVMLTSTGIAVVYNYALEATGRILNDNCGNSRELTVEKFSLLVEANTVDIIFKRNIDELPLRNRAKLRLTERGRIRQNEIIRELQEQGLWPS